MDQASKIVSHMMDHDAFSQWLGIKVLEVRAGYALLSMKVRREMVNGFLVCHGGITFSLADSAFAFASNGHGRLSLALEANISYPAPVHVDDTLTAEAVELSIGNRTGVFQVTITNQDETVVGVFRGTVYRTQKDFEEELAKQG